MAVLSVCRSLVQARTGLVSAKRYAGHGNIIAIRPSLFQWKKFKDILHLYTLIGVIPIFLVHLYVVIFYGDPQLAEIPEGYQPEYWEYERNPYARLIMKYLAADPVANYERMLHLMNEAQEKRVLGAIVKRADNIMSYRRDYQAWYYKAVEAKHFRRVREDYRTASETAGDPEKLP